MQNYKKTGFSLAEMIITMFVIIIFMVAAAPMLTVKQNYAGVDTIAAKCVIEDSGNTSASSCIAAMAESQTDRANSLSTLIAYANGDNSTYSGYALTVIDQTCNDGGTAACDYLIRRCMNDSNNCDVSGETYDIYKYLQMAATSTNEGKTYMFQKLKHYFDKGITLNFVTPVQNACNADSASMACKLLEDQTYNFDLWERSDFSEENSPPVTVFKQGKVELDLDSSSAQQEHYIAVAAYDDNNSRYKVYLYKRGESYFEEVQKLDDNSKECNDIEVFTIDGNTYLAGAVSDDSDDRCPIYKWNESTGNFDYYQDNYYDEGYGTSYYAIDFFEDSGNYYLVYGTDSWMSLHYAMITKWNSGTSQFEKLKSLDKRNFKIWSINTFSIDGTTYAVIGDDSTPAYYEWNSGTETFNYIANFTNLPSTGYDECGDAHHFTMGSDDYIVLGLSDLPNWWTNGTPIYKWNSGTSRFDHVENLSYASLKGFATFNIGGTDYLAGAQHTTPFSTHSVYSWNGSTFDNHVQDLDLISGIDDDVAYQIEHFNIDSTDYLAIGFGYGDDDGFRVVKWDGAQFIFDSKANDANSQPYDYLKDMAYFTAAELSPIEAYVTTTDSNQVSNAGSIIASVSITETDPDGSGTDCEIRWMVSFDGRATWKYHNGSSWQTDILDNFSSSVGSTKAQLESVLTNYTLSSGETLDFAFWLYATPDAASSPSVDKVEVKYL